MSKTTIKTSELQGAFDRYRRLPLAGDLEPNLDFQWWQEGVANLAEVTPIIAKQYREDRTACIMHGPCSIPGR
jgi:hypothetical protein